MILCNQILPTKPSCSKDENAELREKIA